MTVSKCRLDVYAVITMKRLLPLALLAIGAQASHAMVMLDNYDSGAIDLLLNWPNNSIQTNRVGTMVGGQVWTELAIAANSNQNNARLRVNTSLGRMDVSSEVLVQALMFSTYGVDSAGDFSASSDLNLDLSGESRFEVDFFYVETPLLVSITLYDAESIYGSTQVTTTVSSGFSKKASFDFSAFTGYDFSDVDAILFDITAPTSSDYSINSFSAVPEPASMAALGLGLACLARRRKRS